MPSLEHEALVDMFRDRPTLIVDLLRALDVDVPPHATITIVDSSLADPRPTALAADLVLELCDAPGRPVLTAILEVQLDPDPDKLASWPVYLVLHRRRRRCDTCVLVLTPSRAVAAWARRPIRLGPGNPAFRVLVLGPDEVPVITDPAAAVANPALAFLSALTHGDDPDAGIAVLSAALDALPHVDNATASMYLHIVTRALSGPRRRFLKERLMLDFNKYEIPFPDFLVPEAEKIGERKAARRLAKKLLERLDLRKISLTPEQRAVVLSCTDFDQAFDWFDRAYLAQTADDVFDPPADAK